MADNYQDMTKEQLLQEASNRGVTNVNTNSSKDEIVQALKQSDTQGASR